MSIKAGNYKIAEKVLLKKKLFLNPRISEDCLVRQCRETRKKQNCPLRAIFGKIVLERRPTRQIRLLIEMLASKKLVERVILKITTLFIIVFEKKVWK